MSALREVRLFRTIRGRWRTVHVGGCPALARSAGADEVTGCTPSSELFSKWWWRPCGVCRPELVEEGE